LNVIIALVSAAEERAECLKPDPDSDDGGYGLQTARHLLIDLRDYLRHSAAGEKAGKQ